MPIGAVAGKREFIDTLDGGNWSLGDGSRPQTEMTYSAGTFCRHPLSMATARAVLLYLQEQGAAVQDSLNDRTAEFATRINECFRAADAPFKLHHFGSFFRFAIGNNLSFVYQPLEMALFMYHLIDNGVYISMGGTCFLSTAHTNADLDQIVEAVKHTVEEMKAGGFLNTAKGSTLGCDCGYQID
jgi:glutamate-1-semialdehyde aminotransferase